MVMSDYIGKDISFALATFPGVLLCAEHNGFAALHPVDAVNHFIQPFHLLKQFGIDVEQILLYRGISPDFHNDDSCLLVLIARLVELP